MSDEILPLVTIANADSPSFGYFREAMEREALRDFGIPIELVGTSTNAENYKAEANFMDDVLRAIAHVRRRQMEPVLIKMNQHCYEIIVKIRAKGKYRKRSFRGNVSRHHY